MGNMTFNERFWLTSFLLFFAEHWGDIFYDMYEFKGNGNVVYGSKDFLSKPSLKNVLDNTGSLNNIKFDRLPGTGHTLKEILNNHN